MTPVRIYKVLFLSRRGSARGPVAAAILNKVSEGRFIAHSAAVEPATEIEPLALEVLLAFECPTAEVRPVHYSEYASEGSDDLDFVFPLSDTAAGEPLPEWPGHPVSAHWSCSTPVLVQGGLLEKRQAYSSLYRGLERRLGAITSLPIASLDRTSLKAHVEAMATDERI